MKQGSRCSCRWESQHQQEFSAHSGVDANTTRETNSHPAFGQIRLEFQSKFFILWLPDSAWYCALGWVTAVTDHFVCFSSLNLG